MFPRVTPSFLIGQRVDITFGASKIFPSLPKIATPITGNIIQIGDDFPGFGIVIPESIVIEKMREIGYKLSPPYKVVAYMKNLRDMDDTRAKYSKYNIRFDQDTIREFQAKLSFIRSVFFGVSFFLA